MNKKENEDNEDYCCRCEKGPIDYSMAQKTDDGPLCLDCFTREIDFLYDSWRDEESN